MVRCIPVALVDGLLRAQSATIAGVPATPQDSKVDLVALGLDVIHDLVTSVQNA